jgi:hypothetical protein
LVWVMLSLTSTRSWKMAAPEFQHHATVLIRFRLKHVAYE